MMPQWKFWTVLLLTAIFVPVYGHLPGWWSVVGCIVYGLVFSTLLVSHVRGFGREES